MSASEDDLDDIMWLYRSYPSLLFSAALMALM